MTDSPPASGPRPVAAPTTYVNANRVWVDSRLRYEVGLRYEGTLVGERVDPDGTSCDMRVYGLAR